jgi:hypothetical protein
MFLRKNHKLLFYAAWLIINCIQAATTELFDDEAYYWIYARFPDWGYFDHPPLIAILIKAGYAIFHNELGVRLLIVLLNTATIFITQQLLEKKDDYLFYAVTGSMAVAQIGGIIAVPDVPLLFFTALFFWLYKRFIQQMNGWNTVYLGICMALLLYSKYHGILIIFFTCLSNIKLFTRYQWYVAGIIGALLFMPHLYWQYTHDFPSLQYHLFERNAGDYRPAFTAEYLIAQLFLFGPLMGWLFFWALYHYKTSSYTEKALLFSGWGVLLVFLISTFKGRVEANWTATAFVPFMVLGHQYLLQHTRLRRWLYKSLPLTLLVVLMGRLYMMINVSRISWLEKDEFHENITWANDIQQKAGALPVVFINSYQQASKYWFYGHRPSFSLNTPYYRRNNFNFWPIEDSLLGKPVFLYISQPGPYFQQFFMPKRWNFPQKGALSHFYSFSKVSFTDVKTIECGQGRIQLQTVVRLPQHYINWLQHPVYGKATVWVALYDDGDVKELVNTGVAINQVTNDRQQLTINLPQRFTTGSCRARLCIGSCVEGFPTVNSTGFAFTIKN